MEKNRVNRFLCVLLAMVMLLTLPGCSTKASSKSPMRKWTDSLGRELEIPEKIDKVAISGPMAQLVIYAFAPEKLVGFSSDWSEDAKQFIPEEYLKLPNLGQLHGGNYDINLEELLKADPDIIIDVGEPKKGLGEELDGFIEQVGIPFVHITLTMDNAEEAFTMLGDLLGLEDRAKQYAQYCNRVKDRMLDIMDKVGNDRKRALYLTGENGLNVIAKESFHAEVMNMMIDNIAVVDEPSSQGTGNEVDMEQILVWNPDYIIFSPDSYYEKAGADSTWQNLDAIKEGHYCEVPCKPYNWLGFPPSIQRYLGLIWLPYVLYPEYVDYDLKAEILEYYDMFYHCELTDEQYNELIKNALK